MKHPNSSTPCTFILLTVFSLIVATFPAGTSLAGGSHPGDEPVAVSGDFPEGTAVRLVDPYLLDLDVECVPKLPDPIGPVTLLPGHWNDTEVDSVAGYDVASCTFFSPEELCEQMPELAGPSLTPLAGDWNGDGVDTLAFFDAQACELLDPNEVDPDELPEPDADAWRFLAGDWEGRDEDSIAIARPEKIGDGAGGLLLAGNFDGSGDTFGVFDPETGFAFYDAEAKPQEEFPLLTCFEWEVDSWYVRTPGVDFVQVCQMRKCCPGSPCSDYLVYK